MVSVLEGLLAQRKVRKTALASPQREKQGHESPGVLATSTVKVKRKGKVSKGVDQRCDSRGFVNKEMKL